MPNFGVKENPILENRQEEIANPDHVLYDMEGRIAELERLLENSENSGDDVKQAIRNSINAGIEDLKEIGKFTLSVDQQQQRTELLHKLRIMEEKTS